MKKLTGKLTAMPFCTWLLLAALTPTLVGCFGAAAVGMGAGVMLAVDRRPTETVLTDEGIEAGCVFADSLMGFSRVVFHQGHDLEPFCNFL